MCTYDEQTSVDFEVLGKVDELWEPVLCITNKNYGREGHASLSRCTESYTSLHVR